MVTGPRVTVVQQRRRFVRTKGDSTVSGLGAASQRTSVGSTEASTEQSTSVSSDRGRQGPFDSLAIGRENTADDGGQVGTAMTGAQVLNRAVGSPADALPRLSDER